MVTDAQGRLNDEKIRDLQRFLNEKESDELKLQNILDSFKDRIIDKFRMSTEDFTRSMINYDKKVQTLDGFMQNNNKSIFDNDKLTKQLDS